MIAVKCRETIVVYESTESRFVSRGVQVAAAFFAKMPSGVFSTAVIEGGYSSRDDLGSAVLSGKNRNPPLGELIGFLGTSQRAESIVHIIQPFPAGLSFGHPQDDFSRRIHEHHMP